MKRVYFATKNKGKVSSVSNVLKEYNIEVVQVSLELPEPRTDDLQKISREKVLFAYGQIQKPCIAVDSGFYVRSLNGFPKAFVNFALETIGVDGILQLVDGKSRVCEFRNCLAYLDENLSEPVYFESNIEGELSETSRGERRDYFWSDLFFVFIPGSEDKTLAEMNFEEYQNYRKKRYKNSFASKFAEWFSRR